MTVLVAIGTRKGLWLARSDDRVTWTLGERLLGATEVPSVAFDTRGDRTRLLVGARSEHWGPSVQHSDDLGASWEEAEGGALTFPPDTGAAVERVWQLRPDEAGRPGVVWAGVEPTSLWRSADGGHTFELVRGLWDHPHRPQWWPGAGGAAVHTVLPHPGDDKRVLVAMSTGGVYVSDDAGGSWAPSNSGIQSTFSPERFPEFGQCVHKVSRNGADPDELFAQNHHGVYRSGDGGGTWQSIADGLPGDFGFVSLSHPHRAGTVWAVPLVADVDRVPPDGEMRVHRSDDGGATWAASTAGLPDGCFSVVLRDAACVDNLEPVGVYVGARDGVVYASADEGETFTVLAQHLPDVLCVRAVVLQTSAPAGTE